MRKDLRVAIVCDWLVGVGGAERVVLELHKMFPNAPIFTSQYDPEQLSWFADADVRTTWLQRLPKSLKKFLPLLRAWTFRRLDLSEYDLVISSSGAEAKAVKVGSNTTHICYCHAPTHYFWSRYEQYLKRPGFGLMDPVARLGLRILVGPLRRLDFASAQRPDVLVANSSHTQAMIQKYYKRESVIIHPPVDTKHFEPANFGAPRHGLVVVGRQTPYKNIHLAIEACTELRVPLVVIGNGPDHRRLEKLAGRSITFLTEVNDAGLVQHLQTARGFIFPTNAEDFGIAPVEALAAGTPVIAYGKGGPLDYIQPGKNGLFFKQQTAASLSKAVEKLMEKNWNYEEISKSAEAFSLAKFKARISELINQTLSH